MPRIRFLTKKDRISGFYKLALAGQVGCLKDHSFVVFDNLLKVIADILFEVNIAPGKWESSEEYFKKRSGYNNTVPA